MTPAAATWVATVVLTPTVLNSFGALEDGEIRLDRLRTCACQYQTCGHCQTGRHQTCTTRVGFRGVRNIQPAAYVLNRAGGARTAVWARGRACAWRCPCTDCLDAIRLDQPEQLDLLAVVA